jgi:ubiquinone/menaquinone biosynthesis C-methylase UbiE
MARRSDPAAVAAWDRHAARYGAQERWQVAAIDTALRIADVRPHERLVDVATGSALVLRRLSGHAQRPREAVGVDRSRGMLAHAGVLPAGWSAIEADARRVPLPDGWADVVTCAYLLHLLDAAARAAVLAEARRLLAPRPSSRLVLVTVWSRSARVRGALEVLARALPSACGGLRPLDPTPDLALAGFALTHRASLPRSGYPSLVLAGKADLPDLLA